MTKHNGTVEVTGIQRKKNCNRITELDWFIEIATRGLKLVFLDGNFTSNSNAAEQVKYVCPIRAGSGIVLLPDQWNITLKH